MPKLQRKALQTQPKKQPAQPEPAAPAKETPKVTKLNRVQKTYVEMSAKLGYLKEEAVDLYSEVMTLFQKLQQQAGNLAELGPSLLARNESAHTFQNSVGKVVGIVDKNSVEYNKLKQSAIKLKSQLDVLASKLAEEPDGEEFIKLAKPYIKMLAKSMFMQGEAYAKSQFWAEHGETLLTSLEHQQETLPLQVKFSGANYVLANALPRRLAHANRIPVPVHIRIAITRDFFGPLAK